MSALAAAALAEEAGIPKGVINVVTTKKGRGGVGDALCHSPKVAAMSFTGSTGVGKMLYKQCAGTVKKLSLELGGNAPFIVLTQQMWTWQLRVVWRPNLETAARRAFQRIECLFKMASTTSLLKH